jgi:3-phenylpropionate/trans-cinnamate dioxygenase ferredoxin reductase subunit
MPAQQTFVIAGANLAGGRAAEALRKEGFEGRVVLIGAEPDPPYERPPLSKEYLRGKVPREKVFIHKPGFYEEQRIELRLGTTVTGLDTNERAVELEGDERIAFDKLLLATGGRERRLPAPGGDLEGIYYLRTVADSDRLAAELRPGRRAVVVGAGFIGAEVAASMKQEGLEVTVLEMAPVPLERALGREMGEVYAQIHRERGVELITGEAVERFEGAGRVERVVGATGRAIACDFAVVGVGIQPNTELAEQAGLAVDDGVVVDEYAETSVPGIFAAGDVARFYHPALDERLRVEHWANAQNQGVLAAKNMLGAREPYTELPWFWSDQYELNLQYVGHATSWDEVVTRGDVAGRSFSAFYLKDGRLRATLTVNKFKDIRPSRELIKARAPLDPARLRDEAVDLRSLVPQSG